MEREKVLRADAIGYIQSSVLMATVGHREQRYFPPLCQTYMTKTPCLDIPPGQLTSSEAALKFCIRQPG